jgi:flavin reductase (DIM6/NTAB) family NADH-FMN oxidoreductase RutF/DNA-binding GntR family transcriptional regulator
VTGPSGTVNPDDAVVEQQIFRDVIGRFASGVTVITTSVDETQFGTTASAVSSLSLDPPMLLVCLNKSSETQAAVLQAGCFCVNILAEGQEALAFQFAKKGDKFADISFDRGRNGSPVLQGALAHLECDVHETVTGGTHTVFLGRVTVATGREGAPLTYFRGRFGRLEIVRDEEAYQAVRSWVLTRQVPVNQPLQLAELAVDLKMDPPQVAYALMKLASENLVIRTPDGQYLVAPITVQLAEELFHARCAIEVGVADSCIDQISADELAVLEHYAKRLAAIVDQQAPSLSEFLDASHGYHVYFVGLRKSPQLVDMYRRLGISGLWRGAIGQHDWRRKFDITHHAELTRACRNGDVTKAKELIYQHTDHVMGLVRQVIDAAGGEL